MIWQYIIFIALVALLIIPAASTADAKSSGSLILDYIPQTAKTGDTIVFSGQLLTSSGYAVTGATVHIKDNVSFGSDDTIRTATTDGNGEFYTTWTAKQRSSGAWDFYAVFEGSRDVSKAKSSQYSVKVSSYSNSNSNSNPSPKSTTPTYYTTSIKLDAIPQSAYDGDQVKFTGKLTSGKYDIPGATVRIKEADLGPDETLAYGTTDSNGRFSIPWTVKLASFETDFEIYATFEGSINYEKSKTGQQTMSVYERQILTPSPTVYPSTITLDRIPSLARPGDTVVFTGKLTVGQYPFPDMKIKILEDDPGPDEVLGIGTTDSNGRFSIPWTVREGIVEIDFEIYASFDGITDYKRSRSYNQEMRVERINTDIYLYSTPSSANIGEQIVFTGTLAFDSGNPKGAIIYIKDEDTLNPDDLLAVGFVDGSGHFTASWTVQDVDDDSIADIFAVFEGDGTYQKSKTCSSLCKDTRHIRILDALPQPPQPKAPLAAEYMVLYRALDFDRPPRVAIIPDPDQYDKVASHIFPVREGILKWTNYLEANYGGNWDVEFEVIGPGKAFPDSVPDVSVLLVVNAESDDGKFTCDGWDGWSPTAGPKPINTVVCSSDNGKKHSNERVAATAAHEFIHAVGLGHTFAKSPTRDLMCSVEDDGPTCKRAQYPKNTEPSRLNLDAVVEIYGTDGFINPNNKIIRGEFFPPGYSNYDNFNYDNFNYDTFNPDPNPTKTTTYCDHVYDSYDWNMDEELKPGWYSYWKICAHDISYSFATDQDTSGFMVFVLPPATNIKDFMDERDGNYYICEEYEVTWHKKSNTCNIEPGSHIVLYNPEESAIRLSGWIR